MKDIIHAKVEYKTLRDLIETVGEKYSEKPSFSFRINPRDPEPTKKSYSELRDDVRGLATELLSRGLGGKHIAVIGKHSYPWIVSYFAILATGSVLVPLDRDWAAEDLATTAAKAEIDFLLIDPDIIDKAPAITEAAAVSEYATLALDGEGSLGSLVASGKEKLAAGDRAYFEREIDPDVLSLLVFTSGTTGKGKGVNNLILIKLMIN